MLKRTASCLAFALLPLLSGPSHAQNSRPVLQPELLHSFTSSVGDFGNGVVRAPDGNYYGLATTGGKFGRGAFYQVTPSGTVTVLASFGDPDGPARGALRYGPSFRFLASDGGNFLYGTTGEGGRFGRGTVFRVSLSGTVETLVDFSGGAGTAPGSQPFAGVTRGMDGNFYGMTSSGGSHDEGVIFRVSPAGRYEALVEFTGRTGAAPGSFAFDRLVQLADGSFIGVANNGGKANAGVVFRLTAAGAYQVVSEFTGDTGALPGGAFGTIVLGLDGTVYGVYNRIDPNDGPVTALWKLAPGAQTVVPFVDLNQDSNGMILTSFISSLAVLPSGNLVALSDFMGAYSGPGLYSITPAGQVLPLEDLTSIGLTYGNSYANYLGAFPDGNGGLLGLLGTKLLQRPGTGPTTVLASLNIDDGSGLGVFPRDALLVAGDSTVYGRTDRGSTEDYGVIFKLPLGGPITPLLTLTQDESVGRSTFDNTYSPLNANPLAFHSSGDLLVVSHRGGSLGAGAIFRINPISPTPTTVAEFIGGTGLMTEPTGGLTPDGLGNFYGRAYSDDVDFNTHDIIYRLTSANQLEFVANLDQYGVEQFGSSTFGPLTFDTSTSFLGTLPFKGKDGQGLIYRVTATGQVSTVLELGKTKLSDSFPIGPFVREPSGSFLVPTQSGSGSSHHDEVDHGRGGLLRLPPAGAPQKVVEFTGKAGLKPGSVGSAPLVRDNATGRVYGVTLEGGEDDIGVLYRLDANGTYTPLHHFHFGPNATDLGGPPSTGLTLGSDGYIYGGTFGGGSGGGGTLFRFPLVPQGSATTAAAEDIEANTATFKGSLTSNGYGGEYWFTYTEDGGSPVDSPRLPLAGFNGPQSVENFIGTLKGHRDYTVVLNASLGFGSDAIAVPGGSQTFTTPNGAPRAADDTILVSANAENAPGEVLANDIDLDDDTITIESFTQGANGSVALDPNDPRKLIYTPTIDFFDPEGAAGRDSFTYTITDNFNGPSGPLTATATVNVLSDGSIAGDYAGLLVEEQPAPVLGAPEAAAPTANQIAAGFANIALGKARKFTARFQVGAKSVSVKGSMAEGRGTRVSNPRSGLDGEVRPTPGGIEGRITINGRTLILRSGQAFAASTRQLRPISAFTMRFAPDLVEDPVGAAGLPAGSGFAVIRELKGSRAQLVGVLPDGTAFSKGTVIDGEKEMDFFTTLYKSKTGTFGGQLVIDTDENIDGAVGTPTLWKKTPQARDVRFAGGFETEMTVFGGKYEVPGKGEPPLEVGSSALIASFDRGGLFKPITTRFTFTGAKPIADTNSNDAKTKPKFSARAGTVTGTFIPVKKPVKFRALIIQRDKTVAGFFLGTADAGSVDMNLEP